MTIYFPASTKQSLYVMLIMLLLIPSDGDDPMLAQCCTSVVDYGPELNLHWVIVPWSLCGVYTLKDLKPT